MTNNLKRKKRRVRRSRTVSTKPSVSVWLRSRGLGFIWAPIGMMRVLLFGLRDSVLMMSLPVGLLIFVSSIDFLVLTNIRGAAEDVFYSNLPKTNINPLRGAAEELKKQYMAFVYVFILMLGLLNWRKVKEYFQSWPHFLILFFILLATSIVSLDQTKVITNTVLIFIALLAAVLFAIPHGNSDRYIRYYLIVLIPILILHCVSLYMLSIYNVNLFEFISSDRRYGGLVGGPNTLGAGSVLGIWAASCLILSRQITFLLRVLAIFSIMVFSLTLSTTGSGTAIFSTVVVLVLLFGMRFLSGFHPSYRVVVIAGFSMLVILAVIVGLLLSTPSDLYLTIVDKLGKDATLTGRTELWELARLAIAERPLIGWGFDSHYSVKSDPAYDVRYNHYHNGFLDSIVAGGFILFIWILYNFTLMIHVFRRVFARQQNAFPLILPLFLLLILNISEYSLLRPSSQLWLIYLVSFTLLVSAVKFPEYITNNSRVRRRRRRKVHRS